MTQNNVTLKEIIDKDIDVKQNTKRTKIAFADTDSKNILYDQLTNILKDTSIPEKHVYKVHYKGEMIIIRFKSIKNDNSEEQIVEFEPVGKPLLKNTTKMNLPYTMNPIFKELLSKNVNEKYSSPVTKSPRLARILFFTSSYMLSILAYLMFDSPLNYITASILAGYSTTMLVRFLRKRHS